MNSLKYSKVAFIACVVFFSFFFIYYSITLSISSTVFLNLRRNKTALKTLEEALFCNNKLKKLTYNSHGHWPEEPESYEIACLNYTVYNLRLNPMLSEDYRTNNEIFHQRVYYMENLLNISYSNEDFSLLKKYFLLLQKVGLGGVISTNYQIYPQIIDLNEVVDNITKQNPVSQAPINDLDILLLHKPGNVCDALSSNKTDLLVIVKNIPLGFQTRKSLREHYSQFSNSSFSVKVVFSVGLPYSETGNQLNFTYVQSQLGGRAGSVLNEYKANGTNLTSQLINEAIKYKDILLFGFYDSYYNLTEKLIGNFRWASVFCRKEVKQFVFTDDDMILNISNIAHFNEHLTEYERNHLIGGFMFNRKMVSRPVKDPKDNRWGLHENEYPWKIFPPYFSGIVFFVGPELIDKIAIASAFVQNLRVDDVWLGMVLYKLSIISRNFDGITMRKYSSINSTHLLAGHI